MQKENSKERCLFGTDGVRDLANQGLMTPEMALRLGRAYIRSLVESGIPRPRIALGRDTRKSGMMLESALAAGMASAGADVLILGVIPTPGVSFAIQNLAAEGGAVISASHNPAEYNGIKFLDGQGFKLSDTAELIIEDIFEDSFTDEWRPGGASIGGIRRVPNMLENYAKRIASLSEYGENLPRSIVFDCAHGAASVVMPLVLKEIGVSFPLIGAEPNGLNINESVGVMHLDNLINYVIGNKCSVGIAYDGDADRVLIVDSHGRLIDGDIMLWVLGRWLAAKSGLGSGVVATVMSNGALENNLAEDGIPLFRCSVGDRYVFEKMKECESFLGGEQSGHIIALPYTNTGDGLCTAFLFFKACNALDENIDTLVDRFKPYPQLLKNIKLAKGVTIAREAIQIATAEALQMLDGRGRVLIRPSGTEAVLRLFVEAYDDKLMKKTMMFLIEFFRVHAKEKKYDS
ncbi:MAG: phosphoglucosamine mutase [Synergistaceae bacterium]|nr:phosphoglucosamine mutase [Synergistaceae bacterium]